jgi:hypothetical protein
MLMARDWQRDWPRERIEQVAQGDAAYLDTSREVRLVGLPDGDESIEPRTIISV